MTTISNSVPVMPRTMADQTMLSVATNSAHDSMTASFDGIQMLYGESSVSEDIILNKFLSFYSTARSVTNADDAKDIVVESFLSQDLIDTSFPVDKMLNIDVQNGDITLPIIGTTNLTVSGAIIESDSNGTAGDSMDSYKYSDITSALNPTPSSLFIYEKIVNSLALSSLHLAVTLKLEEENIVNGIYVKLYADNGASYAKIDEVESSLNGVDWFKLSMETHLNKADYYIRFEATRARFVRIKFSQSTYAAIDTAFGTRYRYLVGLRELSVKQTAYEDSGEYVSIPLSGRKQISRLILNKEDAGSINYFISANNGSKWLSVTPGEIVTLYHSQLGLRDDTEINNIRVKLAMDKERIVLKQNKTREYISLNDSSKYYLKYQPLSAMAFIGGHISYGPAQEYMVYMTDMSQLASSIFQDETAKATYTLNYVPYYDGIDNDLVVKINGMALKNDGTIWTVQPHTNPHHSVFTVLSSDLAAMSGAVSISFKVFTYTGSSSTIMLPEHSLFDTPSSMIIYADNVQLSSDDFHINNSKEVIISDRAFNPSVTYSISYMPGVDVSELLPAKLESNEISLNGVRSFANARVCFDYSYEDKSQVDHLKFYTPICHEYRVEII